jgi:uncharacterized damage-inducible protein DinB
MTAHDLEVLFDYSYWANKKLFRVIASLTPDEFTRHVAGSYGSVRNTLLHALSTEWGWLERCGGEPARGGRLEPANYPTAEALMDEWSRVESGMRRFLAGLKDEDVARPIEYPGNGGARRSMPLGELMHHVTNHSAHYRGQTALLLRELGHAPGDIDLLFYYSEKRGVPAW